MYAIAMTDKTHVPLCVSHSASCTGCILFPAGVQPPRIALFGTRVLPFAVPTLWAAWFGRQPPANTRCAHARPSTRAAGNVVQPSSACCLQVPSPHHRHSISHDVPLPRGRLRCHRSGGAAIRMSSPESRVERWQHTNGLRQHLLTATA